MGDLETETHPNLTSLNDDTALKCVKKLLVQIVHILLERFLQMQHLSQALL